MKAPRRQENIDDLMGEYLAQHPTLPTAALSYAFDQKYGKFDYSTDLRSLYPGTRCLALRDFLRDTRAHDILFVWANYGREIFDLLLETPTHVTCIDISRTAVDRGRRAYPFERLDFVVGDMQDLSTIPSGSLEGYYNLRAIMSVGVSYGAVAQEMLRVLKPHAYGVISIANGYLVDGVRVPWLYDGSHSDDVFRETLAEVKNSFAGVSWLRLVQEIDGPTEYFLIYQKV